MNDVDERRRAAAAAPRNGGARAAGTETPLATAPVHAADRFRRLLHGAVAALPLQATVAAAADPGQPRGPEDAVDNSAPAPWPHQLPDRPQPAMAEAWTGLWPPPPLSHPHPHPSPPATSPALPGTACGPDLAEDTARRVAALFSGTPRAFRTWSVTVPLDPVALPDSEVRISVSPGCLALRFHTACTASAHLVSSFQGRLMALLHELPSLPETIDIDME